MANINNFVPFIWQWEGGYSNDPADKGGPTFRGVTLSTLKQINYDKDHDGIVTISDLQNLTKEEIVGYILKPSFWDRWRADEILSQSVANLLVDWVWCSGKWGIVFPQMEMGVIPDGIVGPDTLFHVNVCKPYALWLTLKDARIKYLHNICRSNPKNYKFLRGWINRVNDLKFVDYE